MGRRKKSSARTRFRSLVNTRSAVRDRLSVQARLSSRPISSATQPSVHVQALRAERQRLLKERDKKIDAAIRRLQRERLEHEETCKAEADDEAHRLDEVRANEGTGFLMRPMGR